MRKKHIYLIILVCILIIAAACLYTITPHKPETPLIGSWNTNQSILWDSSLTEDSNKVTVSFYYENEGNEYRYLSRPDSQVDAKDAPFYYTVEENVLTVWQGTMTQTYQYDIVQTNGVEILTLTKDAGTVMTLERLTDRPLGIRN